MSIKVKKQLENYDKFKPTEKILEYTLKRPNVVNMLKQEFDEISKR